MNAAPRDAAAGSILVIVALFIAVLFGLSALVVDVGYLFQERRRLQAAADAAALAAVRSLAPAESIDTPSAAADGVEGVVVEIGHYSVGADRFTPGAVPRNAARAVAASARTALFAGMLGFEDLHVTARAIALADFAPPNWVSGGAMRFGGTFRMDAGGASVRWHANDDIIAHGNRPTTAGLTATAAGDRNDLGAASQSRMTIPAIDWTALRAGAEMRAPASGTEMIDVASLIGKTATFYIDGDVVLTGGPVKLSNFTLAATGSISIQGVAITGGAGRDGGISVFLVSQDGITMAQPTTLENLMLRTEGDLLSNGGGDISLRDVYLIADGDVRSNGKLPSLDFSRNVSIQRAPFALPGWRSRLVM